MDFIILVTAVGETPSKYVALGGVWLVLVTQ